jgi:hypothetical protein
VSIVIAFALVADFLFLPPMLMRLDGWLSRGERLPSAIAGATGP